jgi:uncharacterized protein (TIGR00266 family)
MSSADQWYYAKDDHPVGPMSFDELITALRAADGLDTLVYGPSLADWTAARAVPALVRAMAGSAAVPAVPSGPRTADQIDYHVHGDDMQFVEITLDPAETVIAEAGALMYMTDNVQMQTVLGDASRAAGAWDKLLSAGKRLLTGESLFLTTFTASGAERARVAFGAPYPGKIVPLPLDQLGGEMLCQKQAFLCAARGVTIGVAFTRRIGAGLFGGEGFILQRLKGDGLAFVHAGGTLIRQDLAAGQRLRVDTGCLVALKPSVEYDVQFVGGIRNTFFGGEGLFFAVLTGPGEVWLQSLPFSRLADRIYAAAPRAGGKRVGEGSILGRLGGAIDGDNRL